MDKFLGFKTDEILTCLLLIVVGYVIAKMFNGCSNNGFSVGIQRRSDGNNCVDGETCNAGGDTQYRYPCPGGGQCYNLVIDDGTDKNCKNPEGVYGDSNDTYCIQGGLPNPNIPVDCVGHWDDVNNCDINCERKYVVDTPASNGGKQCDDIDKTNKCNKGEGKCPGDPPVDCEGHWDDISNCNIDCERKYVVDTPASNGGKQCDDIDKTNKCNKGEGKCPGDPPVECGGKTSKWFDQKWILKDFTITNQSTYNTNKHIILKKPLIINGTLCIDTQFTIANGGSISINGGELNINKGGSLKISRGGTIVNEGTITNNDGGIIDNNGVDIYNYGTITNSGTIDNNPGGDINNYHDGIITNNAGGIITNNGNITNNAGGKITNNAGGDINNSGIITNNGAINNSGDINNDGKICGNNIQNKQNTGNQVGDGCQ